MIRDNSYALESLRGATVTSCRARLVINTTLATEVDGVGVF
jgi:hypothetical protein